MLTNILTAAMTAAIVAKDITKSTIISSREPKNVPNKNLPINLRRIQHCQRELWSKPEFQRNDSHPTAVVYITGRGCKGESGHIEWEIANGGQSLEDAAQHCVVTMLKGNYTGRVFYVTRGEFEEIPTKIINKYKIQYLQWRTQNSGIETEQIAKMMVMLDNGTIIDLGKLN